ncbi:DUF4134 family protein [Persicitalea jodogahamensis]|uniref:Uncharacterized protein n=1 Tax=Persicitalea jodogahamensis TaxID=402147 RepID=A0A8J3DFR8_9BACT|nr:DUF4134 family protein [Persicitalea jodogahamensis]GHB87376.1 hypothetical protein GCM10007390_49040 [Persicitalea jodogahamensis]
MGIAEGILSVIQTVIIGACGAAGVVSGLRIYAKWNRGEEVTPMIFSWLVGLLSVGVLIYAIRTYILGGGLLGGLAVGWSGQLNLEVYEFAMLAGLVISIVSMLRIYQKYTGGEDVVPLLYQWVGSLLFLSVMGYIIQSLVRF